MPFFSPVIAAPPKPAASAPQKKPAATGKLPTNKPTASASPASNADKLIKKPVGESAAGTQSVRIGNKMVEVKQIRMTKAQIEDMKKQGKIQMKDGRMCIFK